MNVSQADSPHELYMDQVTSMTETFKFDFESLAHPGHVSIAELASFLYLAGLNRGEFRRALDELLHNHPTGRFPDPTALMSQLQSWKIANSLSFTQGWKKFPHKARPSSPPRLPTPLSAPAHQHLNPLDHAFTAFHAHMPQHRQDLEIRPPLLPLLQEPQPTSWS